MTMCEWTLAKLGTGKKSVKSGKSLVGRRQPPHSEFYVPIRQLSPPFDDRHAAANRKCAEKFARLRARSFDGKCEGFALKSIRIDAAKVA